MGQFCHDETWFEVSGEFIILLKLGSGCYRVDRRCGVAEVKGVAELLGYGVEWRSGVGGVRS